MVGRKRVEALTSTQKKAALEEIATIRRNGFNPGEEQVNLLILNHGPKRALVIMQATAAVYRKIVPCH
jgi:hypothetical protein